MAVCVFCSRSQAYELTMFAFVEYNIVVFYSSSIKQHQRHKYMKNS